jgi:hypothetical protein
MIVVLVLLRMCTDQVQDEVRVCNLPLQCNFSTIQLVLIDDEGVFHYRSCIKAMSFIVFQRSLKSLRPQGATSDGESGRAFLTCNKQRARLPHLQQTARSPPLCLSLSHTASSYPKFLNSTIYIN